MPRSPRRSSGRSASSLCARVVGLDQERRHAVDAARASASWCGSSRDRGVSARDVVDARVLHPPEDRARVRDPGVQQVERRASTVERRSQEVASLIGAARMTRRWSGTPKLLEGDPLLDRVDLAAGIAAMITELR